ncbi:MAG: GIY-YIG nuclease family protein [Candidatus Dojkabacteria bacterium]|nr:GIY-YIG nuclease family protein [Candidatus Dojkabacteria bacterium]
MFTVYILKCCDDSLYTGYTNDLVNRLKKHKEGKGSKYVRSRLPFELVYKEKFETKSEAMKREAAIKSLGRAEKIKLIQSI